MSYLILGGREINDMMSGEKNLRVYFSVLLGERGPILSRNAKNNTKAQTVQTQTESIL